jgi:hypothetical protein
MNSRNQLLKRQLGLAGAICGSLLIGLPAIAQTNRTPTNVNPADRERICAEYRNMNPNQARTPNTPTSDATTNTTASGADNSTGTTGTTASGARNSTGTTNTTASGARNSTGTTNTTASGARNSTGTTGTTASGADNSTGTTASGRGLSAQNMSAAELNRLCAGLINQPDTNRTTPNIQRGTTPNNPNTSPTTPQRRSSRIVPPTPEQQQAASAQINPLGDKISIRLVNQTGTDITYQVIGDTNQRTLAGQSQATLQTLNVPTTITFYRSDYGLLMARPQVSSQPGVLEVSLWPTTDLGMDKNALTVERTGAVYLN